jgi:nucleoside-diphosphate-sugar epimerase
MSKRILVTGGAGYIGSVVVSELLRRGFAVRVLDALLHGSVTPLLPLWGVKDYEFVLGDVRDAETRQSALDGVDAVVHLAAIVGDPACARDPELATAVNFEATRALLDDVVAAGVGRFVFASTCSNYGKMNGGSLATEDFELRPVSLYAETKVAAELAVLEHARSGLGACCLRFATVYGASPRMRFDLTVNEFARDASLSGELVVYGEHFWRPYVHVRDAARAVALAVDASADEVAGEVFNVGETSENYRKADIVEILKKRLPSMQVRFVPKDEDPRDYRVSFAKVKDRLGFIAERSVADGIDEVISLLRHGVVADPWGAVYSN